MYVDPGKRLNPHRSQGTMTEVEVLARDFGTNPAHVDSMVEEFRDACRRHSVHAPTDEDALDIVRLVLKTVATGNHRITMRDVALCMAPLPANGQAGKHARLAP